MTINSLEIKNFRNYTNLCINLGQGVNVFYGDNGAGKTNLLEAVYFSSLGKSARTAKDKELINWDKDEAKINIEVQKDFGLETVSIVISKHENKRILINGMPVSKIGELMGVVNTVFFSPGELKIVQSSPSARRTYIDTALCQMSKAYFYLLTRYNKTLAQRNKLLKVGADFDSLDIWDSQLSQIGAKVIKTRKGFVNKLAPFVNENHLSLTDGKEHLNISYDGLAGESVEELEKEFLKALKKDRQKDIKLGYTNNGPQKDDLELKIGNIDIRTYGSQGQQRTAALSLKLAQLQLAYSTTGECPILLLDDVLSELDLKRQEQLLKKIQGVQTIITCTHLDKMLMHTFGDSLTVFNVVNGEIRG